MDLFLTTRIIELKSSLETEMKSMMDTSTSATEMKFYAEVALKALQ